MKIVRCAIYTRKSSEEGLEQAFNSLDAQREACAAYVLSQASEGWTALPDVYDDGGLSGGSLERPALQRLLADIAEGKVDIIVVYKVDRLTRSLLDFAKLVEAFDKAGVSFVSVTQSFNTTTSMGRLTLNMLLSFAQFEREVTAERIRDKIAASKAKGMWMGGTPPLGYAPDGRSLKIVPEHAAIVRDIYDRYLAQGNVRIIAQQLKREGIHAPRRVMATGRDFGGGIFSRGQLYSILKAPIYVGDIPHRGMVYPGQHEAIIHRATWDQVQAKLADGVRGARRGARSPNASPLAGKVVDEGGSTLIASHACKGTIRYRYYISAPDEDGASSLRIPAIELEIAVANCLARAIDDPIGLAARAWLNVAPSHLPLLTSRAGACVAQVRRRDHGTLRSLVQQVRILEGRIEVDCDTEAIGTALGLSLADGAEPVLTLGSDVRLTRSGRAMRLIQPGGEMVARPQDPTLIALIIKARRYWEQLRTGDADVRTLARRDGIGAPYLTRVLRLAFVAPAVVDAVLAGATRAGVDGAALTAPGAISPDWAVQIRVMLPASERD